MSHETENNDLEILTADENQVRLLLASLKKTEAPADFDFRLKARIANSKPAAAVPGYGWIPRLVLPALAVFAVAAFFVYGSLFGTEIEDVAMSEVPAIEKTVVPAIDEPRETNSSAVTPAANSAGNEQVASVKAPPNLNVRTTVGGEANSVRRERPGALSRDEKDDGGGSIESSVRPPANSRLPGEFKTQPAPSTAIVNQKAATLTVPEVLSVNGIDVELTGGKWIVRSVTPNGVGEASGVRPNDVIDAINDQSITASTVFSKSLNGKTITVTRGETTSKLTLRSRQ